MVSFAHDEARRRFDELLRRAEQGEVVVIERDGCVVARIVPGQAPYSERVKKLLDEIEAIRTSAAPLGQSPENAIREGRR